MKLRVGTSRSFDRSIASDQKGSTPPPQIFESTVVLFLRCNNVLDTSLEKIISLSHFHLPGWPRPSSDATDATFQRLSRMFLGGFRTMVQKEKGLYKTHLFPLASSLIRTRSEAPPRFRPRKLGSCARHGSAGVLTAGRADDNPIFARPAKHHPPPHTLLSVPPVPRSLVLPLAREVRRVGQGFVTGVTGRGQ